MGNAIFRFIAKHYPTERIDRNRVLSALWRILFYLVRPSKPFLMRTRNYRLIADPTRNNLTRTIIRRGYWEPLVTELFVKTLTPGAMIIDAGANFGHYALTAANYVGPEGLVFAFEPHRKTFRQLSANCDLLETANLKPILAGLGERNCEMRLYSDRKNPGGHSFFEWNVRSAEGKGENSAIFSLDSFLEKNVPGRRLDVLKLDVQGFEMKAITGAQKSINEYHPAIFCEITPDALLKAGSHHSALISYLDEMDYLAMVIDPTKHEPLRISFEDLNVLLEETNSEYFDVFFHHNI